MNATGQAGRGVLLVGGLLLSVVALADTTAPGNLRYSVYSRTAAELFWDRATTDAGHIVGYEISRNGEILETRDALSLFTSELQPGTDYIFEISAISSSGERSESVSVRLDTGSATPPFSSATVPAPTGLRGSRYSSQAFELFWDRVDGQAYQYDVQINAVAAGSTDGTSFFIGDETVYRDGTGELQISLVARNAAGAISASRGLTLTSGNGVPTEPDEPPDAGDSALLSLDRVSALLQQLTLLMRSNGLTEHLDTLRFLNSSSADNYLSSEQIGGTGDAYTSDTRYRRLCVDGGSVEHRVLFEYHSFYQHGFDMQDCQIPGYQLVSGFGTYTNQYDGFGYGGNTWTGYSGAFDALVVDQGEARETMSASSIRNNTARGQIASTDRYNVRRYLRIENGAYDYEAGEVFVQVRDWNQRFNRFDPQTGQHAFNRLNATLSVSASWTDGQVLEVEAVFDGRGEEAPWFDSGYLRIVSDNGDSVEVLAGTGDAQTYQLVSTVNGVTQSEIRRWDINGCEQVNTYWQDNLDREQCVLMPPLG